MGGEIKIISGSAHPALAKAICGHLGVELCPSTTVRFSNENLLVQIDENVREADVFVVQPSCPPVSEGIVELLMTVDALRHASARRITAVVPYFPYARSDKKDRPRISITARLMADLLETAGADRVLTMDLHSPQVQGFFRIPADQLQAAPILCDYLQAHRDLSNHVLVASDVGESKEIGAYANRLNLPIAVVDKRRDGDDENARATNLIGDVEGRIALIVDDEIASGGTLMEATRFVLDRGAREVQAACVHPVLSGKAVEKIESSPLRSLVVTDTLPLPSEKRIEKIHVESVAKLFAEAVKAIHTGSSVSRLFR
ncbi:MAG: ribose-phosphate pyrophosphokinase [Deltaproteobacteria bacterium]|nr:ribose-phosphate pyrophosphokinase [Deltaproteobacteria bacterium]MDD9853869.1 ribose-phosphate pyrophosphokinase [Deltaproteobacteria bacterium]MDD9873730.1 ribose-phosphate pyrophosphokinase [Deltaproteobacteria bacterium]